MSGVVTPMSGISERESSLQQELLDLIQIGDSLEAVRRYRYEWARGTTIASAYTHFLAHLAGCDCGEDEEFLKRVRSRAEDCKDFGIHELNIRRDEAVRLAEIKPREKRDFSEALAIIDEVIRSRGDDEGQDYAQLRTDKLARSKILLLKGETFEAMKELNRIRGWRENQTSLDIEWWFFVANLLLKRDEFVILLAKRNLEEGRDHKRRRLEAWSVAARQWELYPGKYLRVGPMVARRIVKWQLEL